MNTNLILQLISFFFFGWVGINTITPQATLNIVAKNTDGSTLSVSKVWGKMEKGPNLIIRLTKDSLF